MEVRRLVIVVRRGYRDARAVAMTLVAVLIPPSQLARRIQIVIGTQVQRATTVTTVALVAAVRLPQPLPRVPRISRRSSAPAATTCTRVITSTPR